MNSNNSDMSKNRQEEDDREWEDSPISHLPSVLLLHAFSFLGAKELAAVVCVQKSWKLLAAEDDLWQPLVARDWLPQESPKTPAGSPLPSFQVMYRAYHSEFAKYGPLFVRARNCWSGMRSWLAANMPEIDASLAPGATETELDDVESCLHVRLPPAMRILYRLCNGQALKYDEEVDRMSSIYERPNVDPSAFHGLFGGYSFYDHTACVRLLPLHRIKKWNSTSGVGKAPGILMATSFEGKKIFLNCTDGLLYTWSQWNMMRASPSVASGGTPGGGKPAASSLDGMLRWMEEYSSRLQAGLYRIRNLNDLPFSRGISLFPNSGPQVTQEITNGVQVRCSAVYVPECCNNGRHFFSYSVRMRLLPTSSSSSPSGAFRSCQLRARHWVVRDKELVEDDIRGEGVIGQYPLLRLGDPEFTYQSCCTIRGAFGSIEGGFQFVPGSLQSPEGAEFEAHVAKFPLLVPEYIY